MHVLITVSDLSFAKVQMRAYIVCHFGRKSGKILKVGLCRKYYMHLSEYLVSILTVEFL